MTELKATWEQKAEIWDDDAKDPSNYFTKRNDWVFNLVHRHVKNGTVMDMGCGTGLLLERFARAGFDVYGADLAENMITHTRNRLTDLVDNPEQRFLSCSLDEIPFPNQQFDIITCIDVIIYINSYAEFLKRLSTFLKPGGFLVVSSTNRVSFFVWVAILRMLRRPSPRAWWRRRILNLLRTGIWSGGHLDYASSHQAYSANHFDRIIMSIGLRKIDEFSSYHLIQLDKDPLHSVGFGRWCARRFGWNHIGLYQR